jgi:hypothetical protein
MGVKRVAREADHSPPFSVKVKNTWRYVLPLPHMPSWHGETLPLLGITEFFYFVRRSVF